MGLASKMAAYAAPSNAAPQAQASGSQNPFSDSATAFTSTPAAPAASSSTPAAGDHLNPSIPDEAPPAYTPAAASGDAHLAAGPSRMDFSGPPPMSTQNTGLTHHPPPPSQLEAQITGVGIGYGRRDHGAGAGGFASPSGPPPPMPPRHPSQQPYSSAPPGPTNSQTTGPQDMSPTQVPTPGRPLLKNGMLLVYPKGFMCHKCNNTGYKNNDPSNPHDTDWRKYGKPFTGALAHSYTLAPSSNTNPSTQSAQNFQRPLPLIAQPAWRAPNHGTWNHPGNGHAPPPPPSMMQHNSSYGPGPMHAPPPPVIVTGGNWMPANALVVKPGDPRLGGQPCYRCGGRGRELDWLGFDSGKCWQCRGVGRVF